MESKLKHLEMIQDVISRMGQNSFQARGFSAAIVAGLMGLAAAQGVASIGKIALLPTIVLWALDGFYLSQERRFRRLYDHVRCIDNASIDFSMNTAAYSTWRESWIVAALSRTLLLLHGSIIAAVVLVAWYS